MAAIVKRLSYPLRSVKTSARRRTRIPADIKKADSPFFRVICRRCLLKKFSVLPGEPYLFPRELPPPERTSCFPKNLPAFRKNFLFPGKSSRLPERTCQLPGKSFRPSRKNLPLPGKAQRARILLSAKCVQQKTLYRANIFTDLTISE